MKSIIRISLLLVLNLDNASAQLNQYRNSYITYRQHSNSVYWYNQYATCCPFGGSIDTLNYCRVVRSRIKSVTVFRFISDRDSVFSSQTNYDSTGMTWYM